ncbi:MAG: aminoglycoside phosphotransferase family protein [Candidatus Thorarchaeota archaeon]|nr:aminoglycoside phosphotransferase family protein [Candidatus Thorarchaeota archaeon]
MSDHLDFNGTITLRPELLGGWSSLNFIGVMGNRNKFILKFPPQLDGTDFSRLYSIHESLSSHGICSRPLQVGTLGTKEEVPYLILEYEEGTIFANPNEIKEQHFNKLKETLSTLSEIEIQNLRTSNSAKEYVDQLVSSLKRKRSKWKNELTLSLRDSLDLFMANVQDVKDIISDASWNPVTIHGDLYERNIVFQADRVVLLDLDECCVADKFYDLVYLFTQSYTTERIRRDHYAKKGIADGHWHNLELVALVSVISWSFKWLIEMMLGRSEPNLEKIVNIPEVEDYVNDKMRLLSNIIQTENP